MTKKAPEIKLTVHQIKKLASLPVGGGFFVYKSKINKTDLPKEIDKRLYFEHEIVHINIGEHGELLDANGETLTYTLGFTEDGKEVARTYRIVQEESPFEKELTK